MPEATFRANHNGHKDTVHSAQCTVPIHYDVAVPSSASCSLQPEACSLLDALSYVKVTIVHGQSVWGRKKD